jgi:hypothetical protein
VGETLNESPRTSPDGRRKPALLGRASHIENDARAVGRCGIDCETAARAQFVPGQRARDEGLLIPPMVDIAEVLNPSVEWSNDRKVLHPGCLEAVAVVVKTGVLIRCPVWMECAVKARSSFPSPLKSAIATSQAELTGSEVRFLIV